jgi:hypothetical protein
LELLHYGWILLTRRGGLNRTPNLYAVTFKSIDECAGKLEVGATTVSPGNWNKLTDKWEKPERYKAIDERRKRKREANRNKSSVQKPYLIDTETVPVKAKKG